MKQINPEFITALQGQVNPSPYLKLQSMEVKELEWGHSRLEIDLSEKHLQPFGNVHGGVFASLIDSTGFWALYTQTPEGQGLTTIEMKLNFLAPAQAGQLIGLGKSIRLGRTIGLAEAQVESSDGRLLAHGTVTMMVMDEQKLGRQMDLPQKYLA